MEFGNLFDGQIIEAMENKEKYPAAGVHSSSHDATPETHSPSLTETDADADADAENAVDAASEYSPEYYRKLLWKIDLFLLPLMWFSYGTQQADKNSLSTQAVFGLRQDTGLVGDQFNWLSTGFYLSFLAFEAPSNWLLQRVHTGRFLGAVMVLWGVVVLAVAFARSFAHLIVLRVVQGALECAISPAFLLLTGAWYKSREHAFRSVVWATSNGGVNIITGVISYAIAERAQHNPDGLAAWKAISLFLGALTIVLGVLVFFILGTPREVRWLSEDEKRAAIARIVENKTGSDRKQRSEFKWDQAAQAFKDPQTYFFFFVTIINALPSSANTVFAYLIFESFGFTPLETLLKGAAPSFAVGIVWFLLCGWLSLKKPNIRFYLMLFSLLPAFTGLIALGLLPTDSMKWVRWGLYIMQSTGTLPGLLIWTFVPSNVAGRTKKTVVTTVLFVAYSTGAAIGGQILRPEDAPKYIRGLTASGILYGVDFFAMVLWRSYYIWQNKRRAKMIREMGISPEESERLGRLNAEADMTDQENIHFQYQF
ncbi:putative major facilitator superfamily transporter [Rosellinia necatrix]|uniref:Putative major facilitator superfamily transporter n=1 Tax=Rosellinia necatrix TaxID=77044 RepID=A0A1S7UM78_ROSNE|nr:putative major facilitator superfamily transporter [Rosellinia necatrix]